MDGTAGQPPADEWRSGPDLLESVWRYRWLVAAATVLAALVGFAVSQLQTTLYEAEARMLMSHPQAQGVFGEEDGGGVQGGARFIRNKAKAVNTYEVAARAAEMLDGEHTPEEIDQRVQARPSTDVDVVTVSARATSPETAARLANTVAEAYQKVAAEDEQRQAEQALRELQESKRELQARIERLEQQIAQNPDDASLKAERDAAISQLVTMESRADQISVEAALRGSGVEHFEEARRPESPAQPQPKRNAAVAGVLGLLAASALAWWRAEHTQSADRRQDAAPVLRAPLLGPVADFKSAGVTGSDPARSAPHSPPAESYQFLVSSMEYALADSDGSSVVITSARRGDGKTVTALNLAVAAARDGRRVLLVDADQRLQGLSSLCAASPSPGLTDLVDDTVPFERFVTDIEVPNVGSLPLLSCGSQPADPAAFFRTPGFRKAMARAKEHADLVIVDTPPVLAVSDTSAIAGQVDGIVPVVVQGTPLKILTEVRERLEFVGTPVLGYVFNRATAKGSSYGYGYYNYGYYGYGERGSKDEAVAAQPPAARETSPDGRGGGHTAELAATDARRPPGGQATVDNGNAPGSEDGERQGEDATGALPAPPRDSAQAASDDGAPKRLRKGWHRRRPTDTA